MDSQATASLIASVLVGLSTSAFGAMLVVQGRVTSPSPLIFCGVAGLLVGISLLVVLPQAAESLHEQGYKMETVFVLFLAAPMVMFIVEHVIVEHTHGGLQAGQTAHVHAVGGGAQQHQVHVINISSAVAPKDRERGIKFNGFNKKATFNGMNTVGCAPCGTGEPDLLDQEARKRQKLKEQRIEMLKQASEAFGVAFRLFAWLVHALLDGVLLATSQEIAVLVPLTFAIAICSIGDVAGLYVYLAARKHSENFRIFAIVLFCLCFPIGTGITLAVLRQAILMLAIMRCLVSGLFIYMGFFELMPPLPHGQWPALKYFLAFSVGLGVAYLGDAFEDNMTGAFLHTATLTTKFEPNFDTHSPFALSPPSPPVLDTANWTRYPVQSGQHPGRNDTLLAPDALLGHEEQYSVSFREAATRLLPMQLELLGNERKHK